MRLAYLYSRYPVLSQTFCDTEMLELERRGIPLLIGSVHSPLTAMRHAHALRLKVPVHYAPPGPLLEARARLAQANGTWPAELVQSHEQKYGDKFKAALRARNACYFAELFQREGIEHFHVHFANRAAHTALFVKAISGIPFSITAHGQDFMTDLGSEELLREICAGAEFIAVETDFSAGLLAEYVPAAADKIHRVYNGMELENFPRNSVSAHSGEAPRILSVGRLVEFKGFEYLIAACAELRKRNYLFTCEIIGDGPLRAPLQAQIDAAGLADVVQLSGALPQQEVFEKLRSCDIFALAAVTDRAGASDVFPTVILEAMASTRPVASTHIAGVPEAVVHGSTGLLVPPADSIALADALSRLIYDQWCRVEFGNAGRARIEQNFQVETTIEPLLAQFARLGQVQAQARRPAAESTAGTRIVYLVDRLPSPDVAGLETELRELQKRGIFVAVYVCEFDGEQRMNDGLEKMALQFDFLPDAMAIEAEWQANRALGYALQDERANQKHRASAELYLEQARYAVALRPLLHTRGIRHVHATSSRALLCAVMLKKLLPATISATIEPETKLPVRVLRSALAECEAGRVSDPGLKGHLSSAFLLESSKLFGKVRLQFASHAKTINEWCTLLQQWQ
ncbi:MAG: glycosyltransferase [Chthoniobacterales bacterium]